MRNDAVDLEERRLENIHDLEDYNMVHERHRVFPAVFENRQHQRVLDISAGVGVVARRIRDHCHCELVCNDISPACLRILHDNGLQTCSFDLDDPNKGFPFASCHFDAIICLATIEHLIHTEHVLSEIRRILKEGGCLYLSAPNYCGVLYLAPFVLTGRTFHNPLDPRDRYEFFAHVRYFTYRTLLEFVSSVGFAPEAAYVPLPKESSKYLALQRRAPAAALFVRVVFYLIYRLLSPRWCSEPVICFRKCKGGGKAPRKVIL